MLGLQIEHCGLDRIRIGDLSCKELIPMFEALRFEFNGSLGVVSNVVDDTTKGVEDGHVFSVFLWEANEGKGQVRFGFASDFLSFGQKARGRRLVQLD